MSDTLTRPSFTLTTAVFSLTAHANPFTDPVLSPLVQNETSYVTNTYPASNLFMDGCQFVTDTDGTRRHSTWVMRNQFSGIGFTVDLGAPVRASSVAIRNSDNRGHGDREAIEAGLGVSLKVALS